jgi:hypothetical protein
MHRLRLGKPSPAMAVAFAALLVALGGTSYAAFGPFKGDQIIRKHSLSGNRLKNHTVTGQQINISSLPKVPSAASADNAGHATNADNAGHATNADNAGHATNADNAGHATNADNAGQAVNAGHAVNADQLGGVAASGYQGKSRWALVQGDGTVLLQSGGITDTKGSTGFYFLNFGSNIEGRPISVTNWNSAGGAPSTAVCGNGGSGVGDASCIGSGIPNDGNHLFVETNNTSGSLADHQFYVIVEAP